MSAKIGLVLVCASAFSLNAHVLFVLHHLKDSQRERFTGFKVTKVNTCQWSNGPTSGYPRLVVETVVIYGNNDELHFYLW